MIEISKSVIDLYNMVHTTNFETIEQLNNELIRIEEEENPEYYAELNKILEGLYD